MLSLFLPAANRLLLLLTALLANAIVGGPLRLHHRLGLLGPAHAMRLFIRKAERKLNRSRRSVVTRYLRGLLLVLFALIAAAVTGAVIHRLFFLAPYGFIGEALLLALMLPQRKIAEQASFLAKKMRGEKVPVTSHALASIAQRDVESLDRYGLGRAGIEHLGEYFCAVIVPVAFGYAWFGLAGALTMRVAHLLWQVLGVQSPGPFGDGARMIPAALLAAPAALGAVLLMLAAAFAPGTSPLRAARSFTMAQTKGLSTFLRILPLATMAGALDVTLGGTRRRKQLLLPEPWVGEGTAKVTPAHVRRAFWMFWIGCLMQGLLWLACFALAK
ncbi:MAG: cobalamin biosynthesis protein [Alphaproteobacteria bacterium]|nr:cobalamin biosynthesis protein [Alphaproteobacteria bacterium]